MKTKKEVVLALVAGLAMSAAAAPKYQATLTASGYSGATTLENFPVLVRISPEKISGFSYDDCAANGADISFVVVEGNSFAQEIPHEIDTWNTAGESTVWVKLPTLATNTTFKIRWGDSDATASTSTNATWNADYVGVWHMGEADGVCANSSPCGAKYDATPAGAGAANSVRYTGEDAPVGYARTTATSAAKSYLSIPSYDAEKVGSVFTMSGWVRFDSCSGWPRIFSRKTYTSSSDGWEIQMSSATAFYVSGAGGASINGASISPGLNKTWAHLAFVYDGRTFAAYCNGAYVAGTKTGTAATDNDLPLSIGCDSDGCESWVIGQFDECRLMKGAASADWIKAEYGTTKSASFLSYGAAEELDRTNLNINAPFVSSVGDSFAKVQVHVMSLGANAASATVTVAYGLSADALSEKVETTIGAASSVELTLTKLVPGHAYAARVTVKNDQNAEASDVLTFATATSSDAGGSPGLYQTFFTSANANWYKDYATLPAGTNWLDCTDVNRVYRRELGAIAAYATTSVKYTSEIWKDQVYWKNGGQWCYWGCMWMEAGKSYRFRSCIDDCEYVKVTNPGTKAETVLINDKDNKGDLFTSEAYVPTATGWHPIEIRLSDNGGAAGGKYGTDGYKNTNNLGYSSDDGETWNLMIDPGDGSLFTTGDSVSAITATECVADGALTLGLAFDAGTADRTLAVVWSPTHGGETTNGWAHAEVLGTVAADMTEYSYTVASMSDTWGSDGNRVVRFCFVSDDANAAPTWSNSIYWQDLAAPILGDLTLDGTGGDTLVVKGSLASFVGGSCELKVLTGKSATALTQTWSGLDGATREATGDFTLSLCEADTTAANYLTPGETFYVCVEATANGQTARSAVKRVTMSGTTKFFEASPKVSVNRKTITVTGNLSDLGCGDAPTLALWVGETNDKSALANSDAVVTLSSKSYSVTHTLTDFEKTYYCQIRATNAAVGGTTNVVAATDVVSVKTKDTTTYTWKGGASDKWEDAANWANNASDDCLGYPQSENAKVVIPANTTMAVKLREARTIGGLDLSAEGASLTLEQGGASLDATKLTVNNTNGGLALTGANASLTLDGVALTASPAVTLGATFAFTIKNGADYYGASNIYNNKGGTIAVSGGSTVSVYYYWSGPGTLTLDDSTFAVRCGMIFYSTGKSVVNFLGAKPLLSFAVDGCICSPNNDGKGCDAQFVFSVPEGGYATPPVQGRTNATYVMGNWNNATYTGTLTVNIAKDSPAVLNRKKGVTTTLVSWPKKGISTNFVKEGSLPKASRDSFAWGGYLSDGTTPTTLDVTLGGSQGFLLFIR